MRRGGSVSPPEEALPPRSLVLAGMDLEQGEAADGGGEQQPLVQRVAQPPAGQQQARLDSGGSKSRQRQQLAADILKLRSDIAGPTSPPRPTRVSPHQLAPAPLASIALVLLTGTAVQCFAPPPARRIAAVRTSRPAAVRRGRQTGAPPKRRQRRPLPGTLPARAAVARHLRWRTLRRPVRL
eukprot:SAG22_NODE_301_length_12744_cov_19.648189_7_plen_182_part_00